MKLSIIVAYHNEGIDFIGETVNSILSTIDIPKFEIIIIDDCSDIPCRLMIPIGLHNIRIIGHEVNKGVGAAFDTGVKYARSKNLFLMGCDVRFSNNNWASKMVTEIEKHPKSLICTSVVALADGQPDITFEVAKRFSKVDLYRGASLLFFMGGDDSPHHILEASWLPREFLPLRRPDYVAPVECYEIPCILGAAYGVKKEWYKYIDGFWGHRFWGTLEPLISLKCWMFGGSCLVAPIETAHIFKQGGTHAEIYNYGLYKSYNRMLTSWLLFPTRFKNRLINWLQDFDYTVKAKEMIKKDLPDIKKKRREYKKKTKLTINEYIDKFKLCV